VIFTELRFIPFLLVVFGVHWLLPGHRSRKVWLLICSYVFYAAWDWRFLSLIWISTLVDYLVGLRLGALPPDDPARRRWLLVSLWANLVLLGTFKYLGFFVESAIALLDWLGIGADPWTLRIVLPVGISFYTFQTLSYSIDIYRGRLEPVRSLLDVALFVGFFPQLVAGPIVRASDFLPQLNRARRLDDVVWRSCILLFLSGFAKKACISDNLSLIVDEFYLHPERYDLLATWIGILAYSAQIYCDFSGYSDMAIASAGILGYTIPLNFDFPYLATNIREFWRRWHVSLSSWLRDYLYIPLGGGKGKPWHRNRSLMLTMLLGGLWHGAAWRFVLWGGLHGAALAAYREYNDRVPARFRGRVPVVVATVATFGSVALLWIPFRATSMADATTVVASAFGQGAGTTSADWRLLVVFAGLAAAHWIASSGKPARALVRAPGWVFAAWVGIAIACISAFSARAVEPFIYFQF
jgi:alginate O-acetyltransferase complex protein AlgI